MATKRGIEKQKQRENPDVQRAIDAAPTKSKLGMYLSVPTKVKRFDPKPDRNYRLQFLPWRAGKGNTTAEEGRLATMLFLKVHMNVGVNGASFLCESQYGKPCHGCEAMVEARGRIDGNDKEAWRKYVAPLKPKDRSVFLVHDVEGEPGNIQVWEVANFCFANHLLEKFKSAQGEAYRRFANPHNGILLNIRGATQSIGTGGTYTSFSSIDKEDRPKSMTDKLEPLFDTAEKLCVEKWVIHTPPDRVLELLGLGEVGSEDEDEMEAEGEEVEPVEAEDDVEDEETEAEEEEPTPKRGRPVVVGRNGTTSSRKPLRKKDHEPEPEEEEEEPDEEVEDDEELEEPDEEEEDEEPEEVEEEEEPPMTTKKPPARKPATKPTTPRRKK
jgi:hypothetical protein